MSSNKTKVSAAKKARHSTYAMKGSAAKNALRKVTKHIKNHPNDKQAILAKESGINSTRKPSGKRLGWVSEELKSTMSPTPPTRHNAQVFAQVIATSNAVSRTSLTKTEQALRKKLNIEREKRAAVKAKQA